MIHFSGLKLEEIVKVLGATPVQGKLQDILVTSLSEPSECVEGSITFVIGDSYLKDIPSTKASVVVLQKSFFDKGPIAWPAGVQAVLSADDAYVALARFTAMVVKTDPHFDWPRSASAVDPTAVIGEGTVILPGVVIGPKAEIGKDCLIFPGTVIYPRVKIGNRVRIHANAVIGSDGFGYARGPTGPTKIWHLGKVIIGDDVEIGAGSTIDRGTIKDTIIEQGVKIDNLVQIGHNCHIKMFAVLCAQTGLAGGVTVGRGAIFAGNAGAGDKCEVGDGAIVGPKSGISKDVAAGETVIGVIPARPVKEWWRLIAYLDRLPDLNQRFKKMEKEFAKKSETNSGGDL